MTPFYNVMGVAKAALEATTRYLANDLGPDGIRVNAISPGPMKTLAGAAIGGARKTYKHTDQNAPLRSNATLEAGVEQPFIWCLMRGLAQRVRLSALMVDTTFGHATAREPVNRGCIRNHSYRMVPNTRGLNRITSRLVPPA